MEHAQAGDKCDFTGTLIVVPDVAQLATPGIVTNFYEGLFSERNVNLIASACSLNFKFRYFYTSWQYPGEGWGGDKFAHHIVGVGIGAPAFRVPQKFLGSYIKISFKMNKTSQLILSKKVI